MKLTIYFLALAVYLGMNLAALIAMWADKRRAQRGASRVRERTLFLLAILFGAFGGTLGMFLSPRAREHAADFAHADIVLELGRGQLW